jgi:hypothetical protein
MLTGPDALQQTLAWGVQRGLFAYALGNGSDFDTIYFQETLPSGAFALVDGAWLLRPTLAERLLKPTSPNPNPQPQSPTSPSSTFPQDQSSNPSASLRTGPPVLQPSNPPTLQPSNLPTFQPSPPQSYHRVTIHTPVDWRQWYDFYQAVIKPLVEAGAEVNLELTIHAGGDLDANLIDLSVKESVTQLNPKGRVETEA